MKKIFLTLILLTLSFAAFCQTHNVTISIPRGLSLSVFQGFAESSQEIQPLTQRENGKTVRYVYDLAPGSYHFISKGYEYQSLKKNFIVSDKALEMDANPGKMGEKGYQHMDMTYAYTDEVIDKCLGVGHLRKLYPNVVTTPGFSSTKPTGEYTTQREMEQYLARLDSGNRNMHTYVAGFTTLGKKIPLALFTTLPVEGMTIEQAAEIVASDKKPTVFLHAQIHGHECSPGEGALALCADLCGTYGAKVLPHVNVVVIPRVNCDGAKDWMRGTTVCRDMNRDNLIVSNPEVKATHFAYNIFKPEVVIDMHEASVRNYSDTEGYLDDAGITVGGNQNNSPQFNDLQKEMMRYVEQEGQKVGLRYWEYTQTGYSDQSPLHASHYFSLRSSATFLVESTSRICQKSTSFARRVYTQYFAARALIEYSIANSEKLMGTCRADREFIASSRDPFVLRHGQNDVAYTYNRTIFNLTDGSKVRDAAYSVRYYEVPLMTRRRPSAYIIPKSSENINRILEIASYNGIAYDDIQAGTEMTLRQYALNPKWSQVTQPEMTEFEREKFIVDKVEKYAILEPQKTVFQDGAYIFRTNQPSAIVLMFLMEPDVIMTEIFPITLVQTGLLDVNDIYRLE